MGITSEQISRRIFGKNYAKLSTQMGNLFFCFFVAVFLIFVGFSRVYTGIEIDGPSMMPTFNSGYWQDSSKEDIAYYRVVEEYKYGDIVIAKTGDKQIVKRVIGLPGDLIEIKKSESKYYVFRNGEKLIEPYIYSQEGMESEYEVFDRFYDGEMVVGECELFIMGDNRGHTTDSTYYGCFNYESIVGRVDYIVKSYEIPIASLFVQLFLPFMP